LNFSCALRLFFYNLQQLLMFKHNDRWEWSIAL
jgi:hypothetical protein